MMCIAVLNCVTSLAEAYVGTVWHSSVMIEEIVDFFRLTAKIHEHQTQSETT